MEDLKALPSDIDCRPCHSPESYRSEEEEDAALEPGTIHSNDLRQSAHSLDLSIGCYANAHPRRQQGAIGKVILITGVASGLGRHLAQEYSQNPANTVIGIDRNKPFWWSKSSRLRCLEANLASDYSMSWLQEKLIGAKIDLVIHTDWLDKSSCSRSLAFCHRLGIRDTNHMFGGSELKTACFLWLLLAILPNLQAASDPKVVIMTSKSSRVRVDSMSGKWRISTRVTGRNAIVECLCECPPNISYILCNPGCAAQNEPESAVSSEESMSTIFPFIEELDKDDNGKYFSRFGEEISW
jgi:NADP-dependent 3-hydroxy acid dehydrogenase YdfG